MKRFQTLLLPSLQRQISRNCLRLYATENAQEIAEIKGLAYNEVEKKKGFYKPEHTLEEQINYMKSQTDHNAYIKQTSEYFSQYIEEYYEEEEPKEQMEEEIVAKEPIEPIIKTDVSQITKDEVVLLLQEHRGQNIVSIDVQQERSPWVAVVICSPYNDRHGYALMQSVRKHIKTLYKFEDDKMPRPSKVTNGWFVFDMRNVLLHIMSETAREKYQLENLYSTSDEKDEEENDDQDMLPPPTPTTPASPSSNNSGI
uniref:Uncharacterized protein n=1 Tax=Panagrolaimus sp. ES5 TaxID=591445 RepID=A0AC34FZY2_9BILA